LKVAKDLEIPHVYIHFFGDGRDTDPKSGAGYMEQLLEKCKEIGTGEIATVVGRYYAMDRDKRWERIEVAMKGMVTGEGEESSDPVKTIKERYSKDENDEFLKPIIVNGKNGRIQGNFSTSIMLTMEANFCRWRRSLLLQLSLRQSPRDHPTPRRR
jgi:2,3-bisphosphoglycerate-independent phosphoglycerate mutase